MNIKEMIQVTDTLHISKLELLKDTKELLSDRNMLSMQFYAERLAIFEARLKLIYEEANETDSSLWLRLLFEPHDFTERVKELFMWHPPDVERLKSYNRVAKRIYCLMLESGQEIFSNKTTVIHKAADMIFTDVCVLDNSTGDKSEVSSYQLEKLMSMPIQVQMNSKLDDTAMLIWIYTYLLYPIRMRRLRKIRVSDFEPKFGSEMNDYFMDGMK